MFKKLPFRGVIDFGFASDSQKRNFPTCYVNKYYLPGGKQFSFADVEVSSPLKLYNIRYMGKFFLNVAGCEVRLNDRTNCSLISNEQNVDGLLVT